MDSVQKNLLSAILYSLAVHLALLFFGVAPPLMTKNEDNRDYKINKKIVVTQLKATIPQKIAGQTSLTIKDKNDARPFESTEQKTEKENHAEPEVIYGGKALTIRPRPRSYIDLELPEFDHQEINGQISAYVTINAQGKVVDIETISDTLPKTVSKTILKKYSHAQFFPGEIDGRLVSSKIKIIIKVQSEEFKNASENTTRFDSIK